MNKVQKLLLGLAASAIVSPVFAEGDNQFYVTIGGGVVMQSKNSSETISRSLQNANASETDVTNFKKPSTSGQILAGAGYYLTENVRLETVFVKPFVGESKITSTTTTTTNNSKDSASITNTGKLTGEVNSLQLRGYIDMIDISDLGKAYVGLGLGWAQITPKISITLMEQNKQTSRTLSGKKTNSFAWTLGLGANFDVADGVKLGFEYNYQNFGKGKYKNIDTTVGNETKSDPVSYKSHFNGNVILARLQFNI